MEVIFPGGSFALVARNLCGQRYYRPLQSTPWPAGGRLCPTTAGSCSNTSIKILEVGAGTGGSSAHVLEAMLGLDASRIRYFYTDISKKFIQHGEEAYARRYPFTEFKRFDMEQDPEQQGFEPDSIDLDIGTNCVHATRNITATLHRIKRLLKTNGILLLNEFTNASTTTRLPSA